MSKKEAVPTPERLLRIDVITPGKAPSEVPGDGSPPGYGEDWSSTDDDEFQLDLTQFPDDEVEEGHE